MGKTNCATLGTAGHHRQDDVQLRQGRRRRVMGGRPKTRLRSRIRPEARCSGGLQRHVEGVSQPTPATPPSIVDTTDRRGFSSRYY
jgi:hypothetical protein